VLVVRDDNNQPGYANNNYNTNGLVCKCVYACWYVDRGETKRVTHRAKYSATIGSE